MKFYIGDQMVLPALGSVTLSRRRADPSAILTATVNTAAADTYFFKLSAAVGDSVRLLDDEGQEVFLGSIHTLERTPEQVTLTACDQGVYLARNELCGVYVGTGEEIIAQIAEELEIPLGEVDAPAERRKIVAWGGQSAFAVLQQVMGNARCIGITDGKLTVTQYRETRAILPETVLEVRGTADIAGMVNRAIVVGKLGRQLAVAENAEDISAYGQFQTVIDSEWNDDAALAASALRGKAVTAELTMLGDLAFRCGGAVELHRPDWGVDGVYAVTAAEHRWEAGLHTTQLQLERLPA